MQTIIGEKLVAEPEELIERLRNGEPELREYLIRTYWEYISAIVTRMTGRYAKSTDEFSVALQAFNEAIDSYDQSKNPRFVSFAGLVINRRVIDHFRKNRKFSSEYSFSALLEEAEADPEEKFLGGQQEIMTDRFEIQEEILEYKKALLEYGITFEGLIQIAPKHTDTRALCAAIAKRISEDALLSEKLHTEKKLPVMGILREFSLSRKTIENNRKYIIALFLILTSDMEIIKGYIDSLIKGATA